MKLTKQTWYEIAKIIGSAIVGVLAALGFTSCGITRASVVQPKDGSVTTITITTNNPIQTEVSPTTDASFLNK